MSSVEYVTIKKAAEMLGVSRPTVYKMIADGKLRVREFVGRPAIAMSEINKQSNGGRPPRKDAGK
jgi:excisionase family DNA binding protein